MRLVAENWRVGRHVDDFFVKVSQRGNRGMTFTLSDEKDQKRLLYYDSPNETKFTDWEQDTEGLTKEDIVIVQGSNKWVNSIEIVAAKVYTKLRELK